MRVLQDEGFKLVATRGTADFLRARGLDVETINKVREGSPHVEDLIRAGRVALVITTTRIGDAEAVRDSASMRRSALEGGDPVLHDRRRRARRCLRDPRAARGRSAADRPPGSARGASGVALARRRPRHSGPARVRAARPGGRGARARARRDVARGARARGRAVDPARGGQAPARGARAARRRREPRGARGGRRPSSRRSSIPRSPSAASRSRRRGCPGSGRRPRRRCAQGDRDGRGPALLPAARVRGPARDRADRQARGGPRRRRSPGP